MISLKKQNYIFYSLLAFFCIISALSHIHITFQLILSAIVIISPIIFDDTRTISVYFFSVCFMACFGYGWFLGVLSISMFVLECKKVILAIIHKNNKREMLTIFAVWIVILSIFTIYSVIYNNFKIYRMGMFIDFIQCIVVLFLVRKNINVKYILFSLLAGLISSVSIALTFSIFKIPNPRIIGWLGSRYGAFFNNVNGLSVYCTLGAASFITLLLTDRLEFKKYFYIPFIFSLIGLLPLSKAFILVNVLLYLTWFIISFIRSNNKKRFIIYLALIIVAAGIISFVAHDYILSILHRFGSNNSITMSSMTTNRDVIWAKYIKRWLKSPLTILFGNGYTAPKIDTNQYEHSIYLAFLFQFGIIGTILIISTLVWTIRRNSKLERNISSYIPLSLLLINGLVSNLSGILCTCLIWFMAFYFVTIDNNENKIIKNSDDSNNTIDNKINDVANNTNNVEQSGQIKD